MENTYFNVIGQKTAGKLVLIAVVDADFLGIDTPEIFEMQCQKPAPTVYTGIIPTIKCNISSIESKTEECQGRGLAGIIVNHGWYCVKRKVQDVLGIGL